MLVNISNKSASVDPRVDDVVSKQAAVSEELVFTSAWVDEINRGLERALDEVAFVDKEWRQAWGESFANDAHAIHCINKRLDTLENRSPVHQMPARYDDSKIFDHLSSLENLALDAVDEIDSLSKRSEADIRQLRVDLLRIAAKVQKLEIAANVQSKPLWKRLLWWIK